MSQPTTAKSSALGQTSDSILLQEIATRRSELAFSELFDRYQGPAYALALHLTGSSQGAEDAVQEAMLRVWRRAGCCTPGKAKAWILRIVSNESMRFRRRQRSRGIPPEVTSRGSQAATATLVDRADRPDREQLTLLREFLNELPASNRLLLSLYYGAELNQQEIGRLLSTPQSSISVKIRDTLETLRTKLERHGASAVAPLLTKEILGREALAIDPALPGLKQKVFQSLALPIAERTGPASLAAFGAAACVLLGTALFALQGAPTNPGPADLSEPALQPPGKTALPKAEGSSWSPLTRRFWDFESGPPGNWSNVSGTWRWARHPATHTHGLHASGHETPATLLIPLGTVQAPFQVRITALPAAHGGSFLSLAWANAEGSLAFRLLETQRCQSATYLDRKTGFSRSPQVASFFFQGRTCLHFGEDGLWSIRVFESDYPGTGIVLTASNLFLEDLEVRPLNRNELPPEFSNLEQFLRESLRLGAGIQFYRPQRYPHSQTPIH